MSLPISPGTEKKFSEAIREEEVERGPRRTEEVDRGSETRQKEMIVLREKGV